MARRVRRRRVSAERRGERPGSYRDHPRRPEVGRSPQHGAGAARWVLRLVRDGHDAAAFHEMLVEWSNRGQSETSKAGVVLGSAEGLGTGNARQRWKCLNTGGLLTATWRWFSPPVIVHDVRGRLGRRLLFPQDWDTPWRVCPNRRKTTPHTVQPYPQRALNLGTYRGAAAGDTRYVEYPTDGHIAWGPREFSGR